MSTDRNIILGSRSPRRLELLSLLVPADRIRVIAPRDAAEAGFDGLESLTDIHQQLAAIARTKSMAVREQLADARWGAILTADTVVIATINHDAHVVLGKPDGNDWKETTSNWFTTYYSNRTHLVATGVCIQRPDGTLQEFQVQTSVRFGNTSPQMIDWYIATREPLGKAGGYGLQGAASIFIESVHGSLSNVIGLPLEQTWHALQATGLL